MEIIKQKIRTIPNFPKTGIMFRDITTLLKDPIGLKMLVENLVTRYKSMEINMVCGIESRGFIIGGALAVGLGKGFVPIRKAGKLPSTVVKQSYQLEYGSGQVEVHVDAICEGDRVLIVDDLIATGGTAFAVCELIKKLKGKVVECALLVDLPDLGGRKKLEAAGYSVYSMVKFDGE